MKRKAIIFIALVLILTPFAWYKRGMSDSPLIGVPNSDRFRIVKTGTIVLNKPASTASVISSTPHNLGFQPQIMAYSQNVAGVAYVPLQFYFINTTSGLVDYTYQISVDSTNIYLFLATPNYGTNTYYTATFNVTIKYYLLQETAN